MMPPIRVVKMLPPQAITQPRPGVWVFDFGQNFAGWSRLRVTGPAGTQVTLRYAEVLYPDGTANQENLRSARGTDRYVLKGQGAEVYEPHFTFHGFRYVQMEGFPGRRPDKKTLQGCVAHTDFAERGTFTCSEPLLNRIQQCSLWTYTSNYQGLPIDSPQRDERNPWLGDCILSDETGLYSYDTAASFVKYLQDIADGQFPDGRIPEWLWQQTFEDPVWSAGYLFVAWDLYRHTGDAAVLVRHYDVMKRYMDYLAREVKDGIMERVRYGDWVSVEGTTPPLISTGSYLRMCRIMAQSARLLGKEADAAQFGEQAVQVERGFNARFFDAKTRQYGNGSQFANAFPLYLGIVPADERDAVAANLVSNVMEKHAGHLTSGSYGTLFLLESLCDIGRVDVAYTILTKKDYPSFGYMLENGATTMWELWQLKTGAEMNSHNHMPFTYVTAWCYRRLAGIQPREDTPGFATFDIKPCVPRALHEATARVETARGPVAVHWEQQADGIALQATIPANTRATVWVPTVGRRDVTVREGRRVLWQAGEYREGVAGITGARDAGDWVAIDAGAGTYEFRLTAP